MAIYSLAVQMIKRSEGHSATAAAAYRAGALVVDDRTGERHDYRRKQGVISSAIIAPDGCPDWARNRSILWNRAEAAETRINSQVARELRIALPHELTVEQQEILVDAYCREVANRYGVPVDRSMHEPNRKGDQRNGHWHGLIPTRYVEADGLGKKIRLLDDRKTGPAEVEWMRSTWAEMANAALERAGVQARIDHRSYERQGLDVIPTLHMGSRLNDLQRDGVSTRRGRRNARIKQRNALAAIKRDAVAYVGQTAAPAVQPVRGITHPEPTIPVPTPQPEPVRAPVEVAPAPVPVVARERTPERPPTPAPGAKSPPQKSKPAPKPQPAPLGLLARISGFLAERRKRKLERERAAAARTAAAKKRAAASRQAALDKWRSAFENGAAYGLYPQQLDYAAGSRENFIEIFEPARRGLPVPQTDEAVQKIMEIQAEISRQKDRERYERNNANYWSKSPPQQEVTQTRNRDTSALGDDWPPQRPSGLER